MPNTDAALVLVAVIVAVAAFGHRLAGLVAAASAAVWFDFFLTRPYEQFAITNRTDIETTVLLLVVGAAVTELAVRGRKHRLIAIIDESYLAAIGTTTELVAAEESPSTVIDVVNHQLRELLDLADCRFESSTFGGLPRLESDGHVLWHGGTLDIEHDGMPSQPVELLALSNGLPYGRFVLEFPTQSQPALAARQVAAILAGQVGLALAGRSRAPS